MKYIYIYMYMCVCVKNYLQVYRTWPFTSDMYTTLSNMKLPYSQYFVIQGVIVSVYLFS